MLSSRALIFVSTVTGLVLAGCASGTYQARMAERDKLSSSSGLFCEFVNGEQHPDVDVELNMQMAKRCDASKNFTVTNYKTSSEMNGLVYCCQTLSGSGRREARAERERAERERYERSERVEMTRPEPREAPVAKAPPVLRPSPKPASVAPPMEVPMKPAPAAKPSAPPAPETESSDEVLPD